MREKNQQNTTLRTPRLIFGTTSKCRTRQIFFYERKLNLPFFQVSYQYQNLQGPCQFPISQQVKIILYPDRQTAKSLNPTSIVLMGQILLPGHVYAKE